MAELCSTIREPQRAAGRLADVLPEPLCIVGVCRCYHAGGSHQPQRPQGDLGTADRADPLPGRPHAKDHGSVQRHGLPRVQLHRLLHLPRRRAEVRRHPRARGRHAGLARPAREGESQLGGSMDGRGVRRHPPLQRGLGIPGGAAVAVLQLPLRRLEARLLVLQPRSVRQQHQGLRRGVGSQSGHDPVGLGSRLPRGPRRGSERVV
mmetsp:Transcript_5757/g.11663  ORF Transcript_5757/g.11663 Transcript_5757/m.11663 type:complete len:206 (-) Transcript_5757:125-742(-)